MALASTALARLCQWTLNSVLPENANTPIPVLPFSPRSVAVILPIFIGDTVLALPVLETLARHLYRQGGNLYLIGPQSHLNLVETLPFNPHRILMPEPLAERTALLRALHCDCVLLLRYSLPWGVAVLDAGIPIRMGFTLERFGLQKLHRWGDILTHAIPSGPFDSAYHQTTHFQAILTAFGLPWHDYHPTIYLSDGDYETAKAMLAGISEPRIIIHLSAGSPGKRWPLEYWAVLVDAVADLTHGQFIALGIPRDRAHYEKLESLVRVPIHNFCGQTTLRESAALCQMSDLVITLDTAMAHLAAAVDAPRLAVLYGPTNIPMWEPVVSPRTRLEKIAVQIPCRPCITRTCYHRACMTMLTPERVFHRIQKLLADEPWVGAPTSVESTVYRKTETTV